jgi:hypothetical protein
MTDKQTYRQMENSSYSTGLICSGKKFHILQAYSKTGVSFCDENIHPVNIHIYIATVNFLHKKQEIKIIILSNNLEYPACHLATL